MLCCVVILYADVMWYYMWCLCFVLLSCCHVVWCWSDFVLSCAVYAAAAAAAAAAG